MRRPRPPEAESKPESPPVGQPAAAPRAGGDARPAPTRKAEEAAAVTPRSAEAPKVEAKAPPPRFDRDRPPRFDRDRPSRFDRRPRDEAPPTPESPAPLPAPRPAPVKSAPAVVVVKAEPPPPPPPPAPLPHKPVFPRKKRAALTPKEALRQKVQERAIVSKQAAKSEKAARAARAPDPAEEHETPPDSARSVSADKPATQVEKAAPRPEKKHARKAVRRAPEPEPPPPPKKLGLFERILNVFRRPKSKPAED